MNITGIIAEYNPFHNGHAYQLRKARSLTAADYVVVVMSGDYVQRGVPAILEKHVRTRFALENGADLVLELPVRYASASAMDFASGAVRMLDALNCVTHLCFGSESGSLRDLAAAARLLEQEPKDYRAALQAALRTGMSYPLARQKAFSSCAAAEGIADSEHPLSSPNNILGIEYLRALLRFESPILPVTVARTSNNYHLDRIEDLYASATAIRSALFENAPQKTAGYVPKRVQIALENAVLKHALLSEDDFSLPLCCRLLDAVPKQLTAYLDVPESLANRICNQKKQFTSFSQFAELLKTRETTRTKINRSLLHILLQLESAACPLQYLRVLGFRRDASPLLGHLKLHSSLPLITRPSLLPAKAYQEDLRASSLYHYVLASKTKIPQPDERSIPVVIV